MKFLKHFGEFCFGFCAGYGFSSIILDIWKHFGT